MSATILLTISVLLLLSYLFDILLSRIKIPSVIFLIGLGFSVKYISEYLGFEIIDLSFVLPVLGTVGLILIVLEGALELKIDKSESITILKAFVGSLLSIIFFSFIFAYIIHYFYGIPIKQSLINFLPLAIISSAVAIPSSKNLSLFNRKFVIYESSFSDILGILIFYFILINRDFNAVSFGVFTIEIIIMIVISFFATVGLSFILSNLEMNVKFMPIILIIILIYSIAKIYHLPALIFILIFGLFLGNLYLVKNYSKFISFLLSEKAEEEIERFKNMITEFTFLVRSMFFILFGLMIDLSDLINLQSLVWSTLIVIAIFGIRLVQLKLSFLPIKPLIFIAPRGLITILLFLSIPEVQKIPFLDNAVIIQVIVLTALIMMIGLMISSKEENKVN
ncbi:cation:proton antiporter [Sulfurihydrogenibium azorense]|uniref:cation:proton antiporter domain-containing protein n=1 Tax=Sulfurihydrogenibium azorense TaxID=309806 RepID=UPI0039197EE6